MMDKKDLTARSFIKSAELREKYECGICFQVCVKPVRCKGSCGRIYCMKCVSDTRLKIDRCPVKCSEPFLVERIPQIQLQFVCPYNFSECHADIDSLQAFDNHYASCPYVSPEDLHRKRMQLEYKCLDGHQLEFFLGSYDDMMNSICVSCGDRRLSRSYCRICSQFYCVGCRVPPCAKDGCPLGHKFNFQQIASLNFICDICGVSTAVSNDGVYDDSLCNFGICEDCYKELPEQFDQSKPRELIANVNTQCSCGKPLEFVDALRRPTPCSLCTQNRECPRYCPNCHKRYCLSCKLIDINVDVTCAHDHPLEPHGPVSPKEQEFGCMRCRGKADEYYYDRVCRVRLCAGCVEYCQYLTLDKQRPVACKCEKGHVLTYVIGPDDYYDTCVVCKQERSIKLRCMYCSEEGESYCFQCRPKPLDSCYYKHPLRLATFQTTRECHFCRQDTNRHHYCKKCYFYACIDCYALYRPIQQQEHEPHKIEKKSSGSTEEKEGMEEEERMQEERAECMAEEKAELDPGELEEEL